MQKEKGDAEYTKLSYATAAEAYSKAIRLTEMLKPPLPEEQQAAARDLKIACLVQIRRPSICITGRRKSTPPSDANPTDPETIYLIHFGGRVGDELKPPWKRLNQYRVAAS